MCEERRARRALLSSMDVQPQTLLSDCQNSQEQRLRLFVTTLAAADIREVAQGLGDPR